MWPVLYDDTAQLFPLEVNVVAYNSVIIPSDGGEGNLYVR